MTSNPARPFTVVVSAAIVGELPGAADEADPLAAYLTRAMGRPVRVVPEAGYAAITAGLRAGRIDAAMLGAFALRRAEEDGGVERLVAPAGPDGEPVFYRSAVFARTDSGLSDLSALRGAAFGLVEERSTTGYLVPRAMLREAGLDPDRDVRQRLYGRHVAVVDAVLAGEVAAGAVHAKTLEPPWLAGDPDRLRVLALSQPLPPGPMVVRVGLPATDRERLATAMVRIHEADPVAARVLIRTASRFTRSDGRATPTLKSVAALAGVSYSTVSRVVNGVGGVAPAKAARVAAIVKELGYRPDGSAVSVRGQRQSLVGLAAPADADAAFYRLADALQASLAAAGVPMVLCRVAGALDDGLFPGLLLDGRLGALVVTAAHVADPALVEAARTGRRVIAVGVEHASPGIVLASAEGAAPAVLAALGLPPGD